MYRVDPGTQQRSTERKTAPQYDWRSKAPLGTISWRALWGQHTLFSKSKEWLEKEICTWINQEMNTMNKKLWFCQIETWNNSLSPFTSSLPQDTEQQRYQVIKLLRLHAQKSEILLIDWVEQKLMQSICNYGCTAGETIQRPSALSASSLQRSFSWRLCYCWSIDFLLF